MSEQFGSNSNAMARRATKSRSPRNCAVSALGTALFACAQGPLPAENPKTRLDQQPEPVAILVESTQDTEEPSAAPRDAGTAAPSHSVTTVTPSGTAPNAQTTPSAATEAPEAQFDAPKPGAVNNDKAKAGAKTE